MPVLKSGAPAPDPAANRPRGVMNADEVEARGAARQIRDAAEAQALEIIKEARAKASAIESGAAAKGREEGLAQVTEELARAKLQAGEMLRNSEKDIVSLALVVAEKIIGKDLERDAEVLLQICATAIENMRNAKQMTLRVNPGDAAMLRAKNRGLLELVGRAVDISIKDDSEVEPGGCVVQTEFGTIDAQLPTQLKMLANVLLAEDRKRSEPA